MKKVIIGITGGLAAGKTTVADMFLRKGAELIDADMISHELLKEDSGIKEEIIKRFGKDIIKDGKVDRRSLGKKVFLNKSKLDELSRIIHPAIINSIKRKAEKETKAEIVIIDAPLLIEAGMQDYVDIVVVVAAKKETQIKRAVGKGVSEEEARSIIDKQVPLSEKKSVADYIIDSESDLDIVKKGVEEIWQRAQKMKKS